MKTGIIGLGKMGGALLRGMLKAGAVVPEEVWVYDQYRTGGDVAIPNIPCPFYNIFRGFAKGRCVCLPVLCRQ